MLNLTGPARMREIATHLRLSARIENAFAKRYAALLNRYARAATQGYRDGGRRGATKALQPFKKDLRPILTANITTAMTIFGRRVLEGIEGAKKAESVFELAVREYLREYGLTKVNQIADTTLDTVMTAIANGEEAGDPPEVVARAIMEATAGAVARNRALNIAITETHSAATYASDKAADATGLTLEREWATVRDARARESHVTADGQRRSAEKPFNVGGHKLMRPGDPDGPAEEVVRCRCVVLYHTK